MGTIASTPAILNAVNDALFLIGADEIDAPMTQEAIWRACKSV
jgi:CO/xanthine dehydrogenase Mo-binding subunit